MIVCIAYNSLYVVLLFIKIISFNYVSTWFISETLRKYPVFPAIGRTCTKDYKIPNSAVVIEKGVTVIISLSGMHHDPKYFPDPEVFDPERFTTENVRRRPPYTFLPFGEGQRSCIGNINKQYYLALLLYSSYFRPTIGSSFGEIRIGVCYKEFRSRCMWWNGGTFAI